MKRWLTLKAPYKAGATSDPRSEKARLRMTSGRARESRAPKGAARDEAMPAANMPGRKIGPRQSVPQRAGGRKTRSRLLPLGFS